MDNTRASSEDISFYNSALDSSSAFLYSENENSSIVNTRNLIENDEKNKNSYHDKNADEIKNNKNQNSFNSNNTTSHSKSDDNNYDNLEVDPKSNLANKTIFKTDNPNLSIIEISNDNSLKSDEESVYLIGFDEDDENNDNNHNHDNNINVNVNENDEEHKEKFRTILNTNRQKMNTINTSTSTISSVSSLSSSLTGGTTSISSASATSVTSTIPATKSISSTSTISLTSIETNTSKSQLSSPEKPIIKIYENIEDFEANLPKTVKILTTPHGSKVYLIGTAHFSEESQDDVSFVIRNVKPDIVVVELCPSRVHILKFDEKSLLEEAMNVNLSKIRSVIKANGFMNGIFYIMLLRMSAQLAKQIGMAPGGEFRRAFDEVQKLSERCALHLGDRPISITVQRALRALSLWQTIKLVWRLTSTDDMNIEDIEECKEQDLLEKLLQEMSGEFPAFSDVLVRERDLYLCHSLQVAASPIIQINGLQRPVKIVGVVGIGHVPGIIKNWLNVDQNEITKILEIPPSRLSTRIIKYTFKICLCGLITYGVIKVFRPKIIK